MEEQGPEIPHIVFVLPAVLLCLPMRHGALISDLKSGGGLI